MVGVYATSNLMSSRGLLEVFAVLVTVSAMVSSSSQLKGLARRRYGRCLLICIMSLAHYEFPFRNVQLGNLGFVAYAIVGAVLYDTSSLVIIILYVLEDQGYG